MLPGICLPFLFLGIVSQWVLIHGDTGAGEIIAAVARYRWRTEVRRYDCEIKGNFKGAHLKSRRPLESQDLGVRRFIRSLLRCAGCESVVLGETLGRRATKITWLRHMVFCARDIAQNLLSRVAKGL
jgi:hypothetical protein